MFGFEGLGGLHYRVREGIGFNKTPAERGALPTDPCSHTPGHGGNIRQISLDFPTEALLGV